MRHHRFVEVRKIEAKARKKFHEFLKRAHIFCFVPAGADDPCYAMHCRYHAARSSNERDLIRFNCAWPDVLRPSIWPTQEIGNVAAAVDFVSIQDEHER